MSPGSCITARRTYRYMAIALFLLFSTACSNGGGDSGASSKTGSAECVLDTSTIDDCSLV